MAKEFFKDLPNTTTPLTASRLNGLLDGEEVMGNLVVEGIKTKNMFGNYQIANGYISENLMRTRTELSDRLAFIKCEPNTTYTISRSIITSSFRVSDSTIVPPTLSTNTDTAIPTTIENNNGTTITYTTSSTAKYLIVMYGNINNDSNINESLATIQVEEGNTATTYSEYQNLKPNNYSLITNNGWEVKMYDDGTFEAWYPFTNTKTTTCNNTYVANTLYMSPSITITGPSITHEIIHYQVNASFTTTSSWALAWVPANTTNLRYQIVSQSNFSTATTYRESAYMAGTWK